MKIVMYGDGIIVTAKIEEDCEVVIIHNDKFFVFQEGFDNWNVSHVETGGRVCSGVSKDEALKQASNAIKKNGFAPINQFKEMLKEKGVSLPVNVV